MLNLNDLVPSIPDGSVNEALLAFKVADELRVDAMAQLLGIFILEERFDDGPILIDQLRDANRLAQQYQEQLAGLVAPLGHEQV